jgi:hypothetical protein
VGTDANPRQVVTLLGSAGRGHGLVNKVGHAARGQGVVQQVAEQLGGAAEGTGADEDQSQHGLSEEGLGDGESKQDAVVGGVGDEGVVEGLLGFGGLVVDDLAADVVLLGQSRDRGGAREGLDGQV